MKNCLFCIKTVFRYAPFNALIGIICTFLPAFFTGCQILLLQRIVDGAAAYVQGAGGPEDVILWGILLVLVMTQGASMERIGLYQMDLVSVKLMEKMSLDTAKRLSELEYSSFEEQKTQEIFQKMSAEPERRVYNCSLSTMYVLQKTAALFFSMAVISAISPWIGLGIVLIGVPMAVLGYYTARRNAAVTEEAADTRRRMADIKEMLTNKHAMFEMKLFGAEELFTRKWKLYSDKYAAISRRENKKIMQMDLCSRFLNAVYVIFVACMAAAGFLAGSLTLGAFTAALNAMAGIGRALNDCSRHVAFLLGNARAMDFYMDFMKLKTRTDTGETDSLSYFDIAFENVSFRYPGTEREILKNVTFYVKEGERIAFVGENGAGKSTIIKLLCGLYEPTAGTVTIGGVPVRELSPALRTRMLSVVFQDFQSYQLTLRENVAFGNLARLSDDGRLLQALEFADGEGLAGLEKGLDRNLGKLTEDGQDLSKGEWQRVAMARAFVSDAKYVVLDEPTASLDPLAESHMYENFARIFRNRGTILISHRLASARMADRILVLDGGRIVQAGSHEELMGRQGLYRTMFLAQSSFYKSGET